MSAPLLGAAVDGDATRFGAFVTTTDDVGVRLFDPSGEVLRTVPLEPQGDGYFGATVAGVGHGALYQLVLGERELPDPYARFLPQGVHGPAMVFRSSYEWRHGPGVYRPLREQVIYELHVGTFTPDGTYRAAAAQLPELARLGVTAIELMPLSSFPGRRGWGYDGVAHYAPFAPYGSPDELRALIDEAHGLGLSVLLDVVYNHFGPSGNYLSAYSPEYFSHDVQNAWGDAPNFGLPVMRRYVLENALYWLHDFRFDGLRLDASHAIIDRSPRHVLAELSDRLRDSNPKKLLIAEDERNDPTLLQHLGLNGVWADDFHHQVRVTLTGERDGYYRAYQPGAAGVAQAIREGWLFTGQIYPASGKPRGKPAAGVAASAFVYCIQNHDQIGNRALGDRLSSAVSEEAYAAASVLLLILPMTPLLFMGQEWAASTPFQYFTDHDPELGKLVSEGRRAEFASFAAFSGAEGAAEVPDPQAETTFQRSKLNWGERAEPRHARCLELYRSALRLRRSDPVLARAERQHVNATHHDSVLGVEWKLDGERRLLLVNFGAEPVALATLPWALGARTLLRTADSSPDVLAPHEAVLYAAGEER